MAHLELPTSQCVQYSGSQFGEAHYRQRRRMFRALGPAQPGSALLIESGVGKDVSPHAERAGRFRIYLGKGGIVGSEFVEGGAFGVLPHKRC